MLYANSVSGLVFTHHYIISIPLHQNQCANMTYMDWIDFPTTPIVGIYNVTSLHPQFPHCFLKCTSMVACYGRIGTKRFPRCIWACSFESHLSLGAWEGLAQRSLVCCYAHPMYKEQSRRLQMNAIWAPTFADTKQAVESPWSKLSSSKVETSEGRGD